jgi:Flp pilus assembly protein CpaB
MLVLGVVLALAAFGGVLLFGSGSGSAQPAPPATVGVVTAAVDIPLGTALDSTMLTLVQKPEAEATDSYREPAVIVGKVVRRTVNMGVALTPADFEAGSGVSAPDVTSNLPAGQVAMSVSVDPVSGVGSLIQQGDHVDVILTMKDEDSRNPVVYTAPPDPQTGLTFSALEDSLLNNTTIKVLVQNVQVLATLSSAPADGSAEPTTLSDMLVILSLTPQQVELVRYAQVDGNLILTLRSPQDADAPDAKTTGITLRELVETYGVLPPRVVITQAP